MEGKWEFSGIVMEFWSDNWEMCYGRKISCIHCATQEKSIDNIVDALNKDLDSPTSRSMATALLIPSSSSLSLV